MKKTACLLLAVFSFSAFADHVIDRKIQRLQQASISGEIDRLSSTEKDILSRGLDAALKILRMDDDRDIGRGDRDTDYRGPGRRDNDWRRNSSYERNEIVAYKDDYCRNVLTPVTAQDHCGRMSSIFNNQNVWSVSINGKCINTPDTQFQNKCDDLQELAASQKPRTADLTVYTDDYCRNELTVLDPGVNCHALGGVLNTSNVWSVKLNGKCVNIPDTKFSAQKCDGYVDALLSSYENDGRRRAGEEVEMFSDDYCRNTVATIQRGDNCEALNNVFNGQNIWSIRYRGQCVNITDTTFRPACETYAR